MIEVEKKYRVSDRVLLERTLQELGSTPSFEVYEDEYLLAPGLVEPDGDAELRLRSISINGAKPATYLTFKPGEYGAGSGFKSEIEVRTSDRDATRAILEAFGCTTDIRFSKDCVNYRLEHDGLQFLITLAVVADLGDACFVEIETLVDEPSEVAPAADALSRLATELNPAGLTETQSSYTGDVRRARLR